MVLFLWVCGILGVIVKSIINKNDIGLYRKVVFDFRPKFHNGDEQSPWRSVIYTQVIGYKDA